MAAPARTVLWGGMLIVVAMVTATVVTASTQSTGVRVPVWVVAAIAAIGGAAMTLRDGP